MHTAGSIEVFVEHSCLKQDTGEACRESRVNIVQVKFFPLHPQTVLEVLLIVFLKGI